MTHTGVYSLEYKLCVDTPLHFTARCGGKEAAKCLEKGQKDEREFGVQKDWGLKGMAAPRGYNPASASPEKPECCLEK